MGAEKITHVMYGPKTKIAMRIADYRLILNALTKNDTLSIPSYDEILTKYRNKTLTVRESVIARMYTHGVGKTDIAALRKLGVPEQDLSILSKYFNNFPDAAKAEGGGTRTTKGYASLLASLDSAKHKALDLNFFEYIDSDTKGLKPTDAIMKSHIRPMISERSKKERIFNLLDRGEILKETKTRGKGGLRFTHVPGKGVIAVILNRISQIEDPSMRTAIVLSLFGERGESLVNTSVNVNHATVFPDDVTKYYDKDLGKLVNPIEETNNPSWKTKKPIGPTVTVGPFLKYILDEQYKRVDLDGKLSQGDLFPDINVNDLRTTIQNKIHKTGGVSSYPPEIIKKLNRDPIGFTDLRRIFASVLMNDIAFQIENSGKPNAVNLANTIRAEADAMMGHVGDDIDKNTSKSVGKVTKQYYVFLRDNPSAEVSSGNLTRLYERFMAQALNATDDTGKLKSNRLAALLNFDMGDVGHEYTEDITSTSSETKSNTSEKAVNKKIISNIRAATTIEQAGANLDGIQKNINKAENIAASIQENLGKGIEIDPATGNLKSKRVAPWTETQQKNLDLINQHIKEYNLEVKANTILDDTPKIRALAIRYNLRPDVLIGKTRKQAIEIIKKAGPPTQRKVKGSGILAKGARGAGRLLLLPILYEVGKYAVTPPEKYEARGEELFKDIGIPKDKSESLGQHTQKWYSVLTELLSAVDFMPATMKGGGTKEERDPIEQRTAAKDYFMTDNLSEMKKLGLDDDDINRIISQSDIEIRKAREEKRKHTLMRETGDLPPLYKSDIEPIESIPRETLPANLNEHLFLLELEDWENAEKEKEKEYQQKEFKSFIGMS